MLDLFPKRPIEFYRFIVTTNNDICNTFKIQNRSTYEFLSPMVLFCVSNHLRSVNRLFAFGPLGRQVNTAALPTAIVVEEGRMVSSGSDPRTVTAAETINKKPY